MGKLLRRWPTAVGLCCILFLATACFQSVGDEAGGLQSSINVTDPPSPTPLDTDTPMPSPTEAETTDDETSAQAADLPISGNPTATATNTATNTPTATATATAPAVAQAETDDPFELSATALIATATANAVLPTTQAAASQGVNLPTSTPTASNTPFPGIATATQPFLSGNDCVYEVRAGDTLWNISQRFGLLVQDIATRNGIVNFQLIVVGQRLTIPNCGTTGYFPPATSTPTQSAIGGILTQTPFPNNCAVQYTIQQGDTLFSISLRYNVSVAAIQAANGLGSSTRIYMTDTLCIPQ